MRLHKLSALLTVATLSIGLAACGSDKKAATPSNNSTTSTPAPAKTVTVAVENQYPPFNYINKDTKKGEGFDYDVWAEICKRINCKPEFKQASFEGMIQAVGDKQFDVAADGITITPERAKVVDFSDGYIAVNETLIVKKGESRFTTLDAFKAGTYKIGTQTGTTNYDTSVKEYGKGRTKAFETFPFAVQAMLNGDVDAVLIDDTAGQGYVGADRGKIEQMNGTLKSDELGFIFPKGSAILAQVNKALKDMKADGSFKKITDKYFDPAFTAPVAPSK